MAGSAPTVLLGRRWAPGRGPGGDVVAVDYDANGNGVQERGETDNPHFELIP